jgi:hypothetical protein
MSEAWKTVIGERARALVQMLQQRGVAVGWVGLPRMRDADYDRDIQAMNRFFAKVTCPLGVPFANSVPRTEDGQHRFSLRLVDPATGKDYLARANDGKHMTFHGYEVITAPLVRPVLALLEGPRAPGPAPLPASVPVPKPPVPSRPLSTSLARPGRIPTKRRAMALPRTSKHPKTRRQSRLHRLSCLRPQPCPRKNRQVCPQARPIPPPHPTPKCPHAEEKANDRHPPACSGFGPASGGSGPARPA